MRKSYLLLLVMFCCIFVLAGCNGENREQQNNNQLEENNQLNESVDALDDQNENEDASESNHDANHSNDSNTSVDFNIEGDEAPADQGDLNVWFEGEIELADNTLTARGKTNLIPRSNMRLSLDSEQYILIGTSDWNRVSEDGEFELTTKIPDNVDGLIHLEIAFKPADQIDDIKTHYADGLEGGFVRLYTDTIETYEKASFTATISVDDQPQKVLIEEPAWDIPSDYGDPNIRIEPKVEQNDEFIIVHVDSNLIDATRIGGRISIPNYITFGFSDQKYTNPDGSATLYIENPLNDERIKNVTEYDILIRVDPTDGNNGPHVIEAYGEKGERFEGNYIKTEDGIKTVEMKLNVKVDE